MAGEAEAATETVCDLLELHVAPVAIEAAVGPVQVFVVGANNQGARTAFGTDKLPACLKVPYEANVSAGKVMD